MPLALRRLAASCLLVTALRPVMDQVPQYCGGVIGDDAQL
jgi:hypothetical protein